MQEQEFALAHAHLEEIFCAATDGDAEIAALRDERDRLLAFAEEGSHAPEEITRLSDIVTEAIVRTVEICAELASCEVIALPLGRRH